MAGSVKRLLQTAAKAFLYGFVLFAGMTLAIDLPAYLTPSGPPPIWGVQLELMWGAIGGATFVVAWGSLYGALSLLRELMRRPERG